MILSGGVRVMDCVARSGLIGFVVGGVILFTGDLVTAQVIPDQTLGNENSTVRNDRIRGRDGIDRDSDLIEGGARRAGNLFHSFERFDVPEGRAAYFANPDGIRNIFSRITGNDRSEIFGTLGALGDADLFFMNPNGILFGQNARLDVGGSFVGTTANSIGFGNLGFFSAKNPEVPSQLLTIDPSALLFSQILAQPITQFGPPNRPNSAGYIEGLRVPDGRSLLLLGGQINLQDARLRAAGGRIELGGVAGSGVVGLEIEGDILQLKFPDNVDRADVSITGLSDVDVTAGGGGDIAIYARNLDILDGSDICAGIGPDSSCGRQTSSFGRVGSQAGDIIFNAQETLRIADPITEVINNVNPEAIGNGGNILIQAKSLVLSDGGQIGTSTSGQGNAGNVQVSVRDRLSLDEKDADSSIFSIVFPGAIGNTGGIRISTGSLSMRTGTQISSFVRGQGNAGDVLISARDAISLNGADEDFVTGIFSRVETGGIGNSGIIQISAESLSLINGAQLIADMRGQGKAGNIIINVRGAVLLEGESESGFPSAVFSNLEEGAIGNGGKILITADSLSLLGDTGLFAGVEQNATGNGGSIEIITNSLLMLNSAQLISDTNGRGNSGTIRINARDRITFNNAYLTTQTGGAGHAGNINLSAREIRLSGDESVIFSGVSSGGTGRGGDIEIQTNALSLIGGAQVGATVIRQSRDDRGGIISGGRGRGGNIRIAADSIVLAGTSARGFSSGVVTLTEEGASGRAGDIFIDTKSLQISDGAVIGTTTANTGRAGNITINSEVFELINGGQIVAASRNSGQAGDIELNIADNIFISGIDPNFTERLERARQFVQI